EVASVQKVAWSRRAPSLARRSYATNVLSWMPHFDDVSCRWALEELSALEGVVSGRHRSTRNIEEACGSVVAFEEKPTPARLQEIVRSVPANALFAPHTDEQPFMASMGAYVFSRDV